MDILPALLKIICTGVKIFLKLLDLEEVEASLGKLLLVRGESFGGAHDEHSAVSVVFSPTAGKH